MHTEVTKKIKMKNQTKRMSYLESTILTNIYYNLFWRELTNNIPPLVGSFPLY